ncbi:MAG: DUF2490 domain-containing protein [Bacteroidales bacterium]|nr:DUF2490 domain-containing protein [Bacteroidales bacterium]
MKRILCMLPAFLMASVSLSAQEEYSSEDDYRNVGIWTSIAAQKKIGDRWSVSGEAEHRTANFVGHTDRWSLSLGGGYKFGRRFKIEASYSYLDNHTPQVTKTKFSGGLRSETITAGYWLPRHRGELALNKGWKLGRFEISARETYQFTHNDELEVKKEKFKDGLLSSVSSKFINAKNRHVSKTRLQVSYDIRKCPLEPYASCEVYLGLWGGDPGIQKHRYTAGMDWNINKINSLKLFYRYQDKADDDEPDGHVLGLGYAVKF